MGKIIVEEARELIEDMANFNGKDLLIDQIFNISIFNVLWRIVASKRFKVIITCFIKLIN